VKILAGKRIRNSQEAAILAFEEAGIDDMSTEAVDLFASALDTTKLANKADKSVASAIHNRYGKKATWDGDRWLVPIPWLGFKTEPIPQLDMMVQPYLVSPTKVGSGYSSYSLTLVGAVDEAVELVVPMVFLHAIIKDDLGRFKLVAKNSNHSTWAGPDTKEVVIPNDFVHKLSQIFKQRSVAMWLEDFGAQGRTVAPQVIGSLLGLQSMGKAQPIPTREQAVNEETVTDGLVRMAFKRKEAKEMFCRAAPNFWPGITLEEAFNLILQQRGREQQ